MAKKYHVFFCEGGSAGFHPEDNENLSVTDVSTSLHVSPLIKSDEQPRSNTFEFLTLSHAPLPLSRGNARTHAAGTSDPVPMETRTLRASLHGCLSRSPSHKTFPLFYGNRTGSFCHRCIIANIRLFSTRKAKSRSQTSVVCSFRTVVVVLEENTPSWTSVKTVWTENGEKQEILSLNCTTHKFRTFENFFVFVDDPEIHTEGTTGRAKNNRSIGLSGKFLIELLCSHPRNVCVYHCNECGCTCAVCCHVRQKHQARTNPWVI